MALYVVVHHRRNPHQTYVNSWIDDESLEAIVTPKGIADMCGQAMERSERVFVHRCGWEEVPPTVSCSAVVVQVGAIDQDNSLVAFGEQRVINAPPPISPTLGQNYYLAVPVA